MTPSRYERVYNRWPDPVTGYNINPEHGQFKVIIPEASENLITNPSFEVATTGYVGVNSTLLASTSYARRGVKSCRVTPAGAGGANVYYQIALTNGVQYTFSCDVIGVSGQTYRLIVNDSTAAGIGTTTWTDNGQWKRHSITFIANANTPFDLICQVDTSPSAYYTDGWQLEAKGYPTTYFDGDSIGFVKNETAFYWQGTRHGSASVRSAQTRAGGREMNLLDYGFHVLMILGLGMANLVDQSLPMPGRGELFQGTGVTAREFQLVGDIFGDSQRHLQAIRDDLIDAFKPDATLTDQPMILRYQACDEDGEAMGESLDILCKYQTGLEGKIDNNHQERLGLTFKMHLPLIRSTYSGGIELGYQTEITDVNRIVMQQPDGTWAKMGTGGDSNVLSFKIASTGYVYAGGLFTSMGGVANTAYIAVWSGTAWSALGQGADDYVNVIAEGPDGSIYVGGAFTHVHSGAGADIANTSRIAKWNGSVWSALGTGAADGLVDSIVFGNDGSLYASGNFTQMGGVADTARVAKWDGANWTPLATGANSTVISLVIGQDGILYAGGDFTDLGDSNGDKVAKWNGSAWASLGTGMDDTVDVLSIGPDGLLYAGGAFHTAGGIAVNHIAKWNGLSWSALGAGVNNEVRTLGWGGNILYVGGAFTTAGGITLPDRLAMWNGSVWIPCDIDLPGTSTVYALARDNLGNFYVGFAAAGTAYSATVTASNVGSSMAYPIFYLTGPGTIWQIKNYTTGKSIFFDLTLLAGETAVLVLDPINISFKSSFRGNIIHTILDGSNLIFPLMPGSNNISGFFYGSTSAATELTMSWVNMYWSIDGAVTK